MSQDNTPHHRQLITLDDAVYKIELGIADRDDYAMIGADGYPRYEATSDILDLLALVFSLALSAVWTYWVCHSLSHLALVILHAQAS
jgi:hypothetical protein